MELLKYGYPHPSLPSSDRNAHAVKQWRQSVRFSCAAAQAKQDVMAIDVWNRNGFQFPTDPGSQPSEQQESSVLRCRQVVLDLGANIGDTAAHVIDTGMIGCDRKCDLRVSTQPTHFDVELKQFQSVRKRNELTAHLKHVMKSHSNRDVAIETGPEDYCYYGVEGNPIFTQQLKSLEHFVMASRPQRPIKHIHFFTESVGAGQDGPTVLYLDTVNKEKNFWGSSIFDDHRDVQASQTKNHGNLKAITAHVQGYTLGTLMQKTLTAFDEQGNILNASNHLILKVDIEGGEYPLFQQAIINGTLCNFVQAGNTADAFIEFHSSIVKSQQKGTYTDKNIKQHLTSCGVKVHNLVDIWE